MDKNQQKNKKKKKLGFFAKKVSGIRAGDLSWRQLRTKKVTKVGRFGMSHFQTLFYKLAYHT
jgi:hypothetical protein